MTSSRRTPASTLHLPLSSTLLLMGTITACELAMLSVIFWAKAQGTVPGLALAVLWPWAVGIGAPWVWMNASRVQIRRPRFQHLAAGAGVGLLLAFALTRLISVA